jgi:hypothetical protein
MKRSLRKGYEHVHVTYRDGGYSNNLNADDFSVEADDDRVLFSMDFSRNKNPRAKESNSYYDVEELLEKSSEVKFFQISLAPWLVELVSELRSHPNAKRKVQWTFKGGESFTHTYALEATEHDLFFYIEPVEAESSVTVN